MESTGSHKRIESARKCLALISRIAARGACSSDPDWVGYSLQELSQVLCERTGDDERYFEPVSAAELAGLDELLEELGFVDSCLPETRLVDQVQTAWPQLWN